MTSVLTISRALGARAVKDKGSIEECGLVVSVLTRQMQEGLDEGWREFHRCYYLALLRYAASRLNSADDAADVVQQAYLRIGRHIRQFDDEDGLWRWLACVVRCAASDHHRGVRRRATLLEKFAHWREAQGEAASTRDEFNAVVAPAAEALEQLSTADAELLRLKYYEGWTVDEIALQTDSTAKAVEGRLSRARRRLREIILLSNELPG
jgi:RNA polymerase sigma-70 factor, ECF subfamily